MLTKIEVFTIVDYLMGEISFDYALETILNLNAGNTTPKGMIYRGESLSKDRYDLLMNGESIAPLGLSWSESKSASEKYSAPYNGRYGVIWRADPKEVGGVSLSKIIEKPDFVELMNRFGLNQEIIKNAKNEKEVILANYPLLRESNVLKIFR